MVESDRRNEVRDITRRPSLSTVIHISSHLRKPDVRWREWVK